MLKWLAGIVLVIAIIAVIGIMSGFISVDQVREASAPRIEGGSLPEFRADVADVQIGSENRTVEVPTVNVTKPAPDQ